MLRFVKLALLIIVVLVVVVLAYAATKPNTLHVERSALINATPDRIFPLIIDFRRWGTWSPYERLDPTMKRTYGGSASGTGAVYEWSGNSNVGAGRMEITNAVPSSSVTIKLDFTSPLEGHDIAEFTLKPEGTATNVTWAMDGPTPYVGKIMGVFVNMDSMIGDAFATGLHNLKAQAEK
jgi:Polyketide cyclase / dehydrase and lipid transport